jgi:hypothetical protein
LGAMVRKNHPQPRGRHWVQRRERHLRHGVGGLPRRAGFHDGCHEDPGLGPDAPDRERFHDDDHEEPDFDDYTLNDGRTNVERRLPIRLDLRADRNLSDYLSGHVSGRLSGHLCGRLSGHKYSHVCDHVSDRVSGHEWRDSNLWTLSVGREPSAVLPARKPMSAATICGLRWRRRRGLPEVYM